MPTFQNKNHAHLNERLNQSVAQIAIGERPFAQRAVRQFATITMVAAMAFVVAPSAAHASWLSDTLQGHKASVADTQYARSVAVGTITQVTRTHIQAEGTNVGTGVGAVVGGGLGSLIGSGKGRLLAIVGGAVGGGYVGQKIKNNAQDIPGYEVTIRIATNGGGYQAGQLMTFTEPKSKESLANGSEDYYPKDVVDVTRDAKGTPQIRPYQKPDNVVGARPAQFGNPSSNSQQGVNSQYGNNQPQSGASEGVVYSTRRPGGP